MTENSTAKKKTALVTGANKGIGYEIAAGLARLGFRVGVGARDTGRRDDAVEKLRAEGLDVFGVPLDVTDDASVAAAAAQLEEQGGLDVLVNNAAITGGVPQEPSKVSADQVLRVVDTNVVGVIRVTNAMLPLLRRAGSPRIVNVSSTVGSLTLQTAQAEAVGPISGGVLADEVLPQRRHGPVRQGARRGRDPGQRRVPRVRGDRPQRPPRDPYARAGRRGLPRARHVARRRAERHLPRRRGHPALVRWPMAREQPEERAEVACRAPAGRVLRQRRGCPGRCCRSAFRPSGA